MVLKRSVTRNIFITNVRTVVERFCGTKEDCDRKYSYYQYYKSLVERFCGTKEKCDMKHFTTIVV